MNKVTLSILLGIIGIFVGYGLNILVRKLKKHNEERKAEDIILKAEKEAGRIKRDAMFEAKEEVHSLKQETEKEIEKRKAEVKENENRLFQREKNSDRREELLQKREENLDDRDQKLTEDQKKVQEEQAKVENIIKEQIEKLSSISGLNKEKARKEVMSLVEKEMNNEIAEYIKDRREEADLELDKEAKELLVRSIERYASSVANEQTVTVVSIPNDEMKGRLIGREGRNIRTIEAITGVDLIIDDTPEAVVLSSFDPFRREIARLTLEKLIEDGRIHPGRIEEIYDSVSKEMNKKVLELGQNALDELGISKMSRDLVQKLGKLNYRTSYGQNVLSHSLQVANIAGILAGELGEDVNLAKRAGLLHDIGKAIDHNVEGSHVTLGVELASKGGEPKEVIDAIASHHGDTVANSVIAVLVAIADTVSASRPGARSDSLENYLKRIKELEDITNDMEGVEKTYAVQAGRELRVLVKPDQVDDTKTFKLARDIKNKIEANLKYPGTIKVTVIREQRAEEEAK